ncbi:8455_t:CDS:2, partial [Gigaspora rosea]
LSDKPLIRSNSPKAGNKNTSTESENEKSTYNNVNLVSETDQGFNAICNVNDNTDKKCNAQLKVPRG